MSIKIKTRKEVVDGKAGRRILEIEGCLKKEELPTEYTNIEPSVWGDVGSYGQLITASTYGICVTKWYNESNFRKTLDLLVVSGKRLHEINEKIKKLKAEWQGEETFVI